MALPPRFPCWVRAVYSWGGETDKDLGFVEGDLIECLNAGDGQWWMGRLRRDRRTMGLFPSNFVQVLDQDFVPVSRSVSPMPMSGDAIRKNSVENLERKKEQAKKRKPFQGYKTAAPSTSASTSRNSTPLRNVQNVPVSQAQPHVQPQYYNGANIPSTALWQQRPSSRIHARSLSPVPQPDYHSPPPPPPPPHRTMAHSYRTPQRTPSPASHSYDTEDRYRATSRTPSPAPPSLNGHTPPMIRDAMDGVLSSLDGMSMAHVPQPHSDRLEETLNPWSPEAFDNFRTNTAQPGPRPQTSLGLASAGSTYSEEARERYSSRHNSPDRYLAGTPQLETYVQRMERQLEQRARQREGSEDRYGTPPEPPPKNSPWQQSPSHTMRPSLSVRRRKSTYDVAGSLDRTYTTKTNSTSSSSGVRSQASNFSTVSSRTSQSVFSGFSAGGFSATSAGSLARKRDESLLRARPMTSHGVRSRDDWDMRPPTPDNDLAYHSSHDSSRAGASSVMSSHHPASASSGLGGFNTPTPKAKKAGLFKKFNDSVKTSFASARSTIAPNGANSRPSSPSKSSYNDGITSIAGGTASPTKTGRPQSAASNSRYGVSAAAEMGLETGAGAAWLRTRRDVNRSNTPGPVELRDRAHRCQMLNEPVICPADELYETVQGDEDADGQPTYAPFQLSNPSFSQVDKAARHITSLPSSITAASLATGYVCRPYRSDVQRLRAIFIWCAERITWTPGLDAGSYLNHGVDTRRVIQQKSGDSRDVAAVVLEMCHAIGLEADMVQGCLKRPGEALDLNATSGHKAKHYWNTVLVDGEWRMMDASLASPTNPERSQYSSVSSSIAESWYFLARPGEICWTHVPVDHHHQHMVPAVRADTLLALPTVCPPFFRLEIGLHAYDTSLLHLDSLEMCTVSVDVPVDVEIYAEVESQTYHHDPEGDLYDDPDATSKMRALAQAKWYRRSSHPDILQKRFVVKAVLPADEQRGTLKIYAGKKGLMHSAKEIVHPLAMALPLSHTGDNPAYEFMLRHPTPHATRHDLYVVQPQCHRLGHGENYVFGVRQHPSSVIHSNTPSVEQSGFDLHPRSSSPNPLIRPSSALSMTSSAAGGSNQGSDPSTSHTNPTSGQSKDKPAKLAIQTPSGRIVRMNRKHEAARVNQEVRERDGEVVGSIWETSVKVSERGVWRGLVLADRSARWCVWGEWECV